jgi:hypothetical protein
MPAETTYCFNPGSFWILSLVVTTLTGTVSALFGLLMLSYRGRIQSAEQRESACRKEQELAAGQRDEALWRLQRTRQEYRTFVEEEVEPGRGQSRRSLGGAPR